MLTTLLVVYVAGVLVTGTEFVWRLQKSELAWDRDGYAMAIRFALLWPLWIWRR